MQGNNEIVLCHQAMIDAMQFYFEKQIYREGQVPKVTAVKPENRHSTSVGFVIHTDGIWDDPSKPSQEDQK